MSICLFTSCSLEETPLSKFGVEEAYKDSTLTYVNTVASVYSAVSDKMYGDDYSIQSLNEFTSDATLVPGRQGDWIDGGVWQNLFLHNFVPSCDIYSTIWNYLYKMIGLCNSSIDKLAKIDNINKSAKVYSYELRAFRALHYYYLMDLFAQVPLVTSSSTPISGVKQSSRSEIFKYIVNELTECLPFLSDAMSQQKGIYYGRMTKAIAYMVLAKCAINAPIYTTDDTSITSYKTFVGNDLSGACTASETKGSIVSNLGKNIIMTIDGNKLNAWNAAIYCANKIKSLGYQLEESYADNFIVANEKSIENIWAIPNDDSMYKRWDGCLIRSIHYNHAAAMNYSGWNGMCATVRAMKVQNYGKTNQDPRLNINYYTGTDYTKDTNGKLVNDGATDQNLEYEPLKVIVDFGANANPHDIKCAGARFKKYEFDSSSTVEGELNNDMVIFRYADALLIKAEAEYRLGEKSTALIDLNTVRSRVNAPQRANITLDDILNERMAEFAWEGVRRPDQIRFCTFTQPTIDRYEGVDHNASADGYNNDTQGYTCVFPIPSTVLSLNPMLRQNPGY